MEESSHGSVPSSLIAVFSAAAFSKRAGVKYRLASALPVADASHWGSHQLIIGSLVSEADPEVVIGCVTNTHDGRIRNGKKQFMLV